MKLGSCLLCLVLLLAWPQSTAKAETSRPKPKGQSEAISSTNAAAQEAPDVKLFEAVLAFAQSLSEWALLIAAGSLAALVGTSYRRPQKIGPRLNYLWFIPGWILLAISLHYGAVIQNTYIAFRIAKTEDATIEQIQTLNHSSICQLKTLQFALICFAIWLASYLGWWILNNDPGRVKE